MQLDFVNFYAGVLDVGQQRASLVANNIANADTPGFKARDVDFNQALTARLEDGSEEAVSAEPLYRAAAVVALDGNDVAIDSERIESAQNAQRMMGAATFLRQSTADLITALRPNAGGV